MKRKFTVDRALRTRQLVCCAILSALSVVLLLIGGVSGILDSLTGFISAPTGMIILMAVGYDLDLKQIQWKQTSRFIAMRLASMAVLLVILLAVNKLLLGGAIHTGAAVLLAILPPPYVLPIFSDDESQRTALSSAISALTLVTMILFAVMAVLVLVYSTSCFYPNEQTRRPSASRLLVSFILLPAGLWLSGPSQCYRKTLHRSDTSSDRSHSLPEWRSGESPAWQS